MDIWFSKERVHLIHHHLWTSQVYPCLVQVEKMNRENINVLIVFDNFIISLVGFEYFPECQEKHRITEHEEWNLCLLPLITTHTLTLEFTGDENDYFFARQLSTLCYLLNIVQGCWYFCYCFSSYPSYGRQLFIWWWLQGNRISNGFSLLGNLLY